MLIVRFSPTKFVRPLLPEQIRLRYLVALLSLVGATGLKFAHQTLTGTSGGDNTPFITYFLAIIIVAWISGFIPGLLTVLGSLLLSNFLFIEPVYTLKLGGFEAATNLLLFAGEGVLICFIGRALHQALAETRKELAESKALAGKLETERNRFVVTLSSIGDAVLATDTGGRVNFMNPVAIELTGWTFEEAANKSVSEVFKIISEENRQKVQNPVERVLTEGVVVGLANHTLLIRKDGREVQIDDSGAPIRDEQGQVIGAVLAFRDVSERRRAELAQDFLLKAGQVLASSLDYEITLQNLANLAVPEMADWCSIHVPEPARNGQPGEIRQVALSHIDPAKMELLWELQRNYPFDPNETRGIPHVLRSGVPEFVPLLPQEVFDQLNLEPAHRKILQELDFSSYLIVPMLSHGEVLGALSFIRTSRQRPYDREDLALALELARRAALAVDNARLYREAQRSIELRNEFLSIAAHELKTPVTSLKGYSQLLVRQLDGTKQIAPDRVRRVLQVIDEQSNKLVQLVAQLLDIARLETGRLHLERRPTDLVVLLQNLLENHQMALASTNRHSLEFSIEGNYSSLVVSVDALRLEQVLTNLITNAVKFSPEGGPVKVSLGLFNPATAPSESEPEKTWVVIKVQDQGIGVPESSRAHLFERFYQAHTAEGGYATGMGLGLYISQEIISLHSGTITAEFPDEGGSRFVVKLPLSAENRLD